MILWDVVEHYKILEIVVISTQRDNARFYKRCKYEKRTLPASSLARECSFFRIYSAPARHEQDAKRLRMATLIPSEGKSNGIIGDGVV